MGSLREEAREVAPLAVSFFCALGCYWMLRELKNAIFMDLVGAEYLPLAKMASICALIVLLMIYGKGVDYLGKRRLLFVVYAAYAGLFALLTLIMVTRQGQPGLGWWIYLAIETFGSLGISHLWSLAVNATPDPAKAARRFPLLVVAGQAGAVLCSLLTVFTAKVLGPEKLLGLATLLLALAPLTARDWLRRNEVKDEVNTNRDKAGPAEGLRLVLVRPYLMCIVFVVMSYEYIGAFLDFQMNRAAKAYLHDVRDVTQFLATYGCLANSLSLLFALTGTGFLVRKLGVRTCLIIYPCLLALTVVSATSFPGLWSFFAAMIALKGIAYGFNKPCLEMLYVTTSESIQFKAKSWIDTAGSRSGKALGSLMNINLPAAHLLSGGAAACLSLVVLWVPIAAWVGRRHTQLVAARQRLT